MGLVGWGEVDGGKVVWGEVQRRKLSPGPFLVGIGVSEVSPPGPRKLASYRERSAYNTANTTPPPPPLAPLLFNPLSSANNTHYASTNAKPLQMKPTTSLHLSSTIKIAPITHHKGPLPIVTKTDCLQTKPPPPVPLHTPPPSPRHAPVAAPGTHKDKHAHAHILDLSGMGDVTAAKADPQTSCEGRK